MTVHEMTKWPAQAFHMSVPQFAMVLLSVLTGGMNFFPLVRLMKNLAPQTTVFILAKMVQCVSMVLHENVMVEGTVL